MNILEKFTGKTVTYIANAGVLVSVKDKKIIFDGAVSDMKEGYIEPQKDFAEKLILAKEPYHNIDYIFTTHSHRDHITPDVLNELLRRNRHVKHIGPTAVTKFIRNQRNFNDILSSQLFTVNLKNHGKVNIAFSDISFTACRIPHDGVNHSTLENIAYNVNISGTKITYLGDSAMRAYDYEKSSFAEKCDILICHAGMIGQKSGREIIKMFSPKNVVLVHVKDSDNEKMRINGLIDKYKKDLPKITLLTTPGESVKL